MREKCFLHVVQKCFLHAGKMFFTSSTAPTPEAAARPRRRARPSGRTARPTGRTARPAAESKRPAAGRPAGRTSNACGGSYPAIKIKDDGAAAANHAPQSSGGWTGLALARRVSAWPMSRRPACCPCRCPGFCLAPAPALALVPVSALALALALPVPDQGRAGVPGTARSGAGAKRTWAAHFMG